MIKDISCFQNSFFSIKKLLLFFCLYQTMSNTTKKRFCEWKAYWNNEVDTLWNNETNPPKLWNVIKGQKHLLWIRDVKVEEGLLCEDLTAISFWTLSLRMRSGVQLIRLNQTKQHQELKTHKKCPILHGYFQACFENTLIILWHKTTIKSISKDRHQKRTQGSQCISLFSTGYDRH